MSKVSKNERRAYNKQMRKIAAKDASAMASQYKKLQKEAVMWKRIAWSAIFGCLALAVVLIGAII